MNAGRIAPKLLVFLSILYTMGSSGRARTTDEAMAFFQAQSLVEHGELAVPQAERRNLYYGKQDRWGNARAANSPGQAIAAAPWYAFGHFVLSRLPGVPAQVHDLVCSFAVSLSSAVFAAAAVTLLFLLVSSITSVRIGLLTALAAAFATPLWPYAGYFFSEPLSCALLAAAAWVLFGRSPSLPVSQTGAFGAGLLLAGAFAVRPTQLIAMPVFVLAVLVRHRRDGVAAAAVVAGVVTLALASNLATNQILFSSPFDFGYPESAEGGKALNTFHTAASVGLFGLLFSRGKSIFLFAPLTVVALAGLPRLWRRDRGLATLAIVAPIVYLAFYATYTQWEGGYCLGPRYLLPALVLLMPAFGVVLERARSSARVVAAVAVAAGFAVQVLCASTSFMETQVNAGYYDAGWNYRLGYSALTVHLTALLKYIHARSPAPIGLGFDRWFVFLVRGGVAPATIGSLAAVGAAALLVAGWRLRASLSPQPEPRRDPVDVEVALAEQEPQRIGATD